MFNLRIKKMNLTEMKNERIYDKLTERVHRLVTDFVYSDDFTHTEVIELNEVTKDYEYLNKEKLELFVKDLIIDQCGKYDDLEGIVILEHSILLASIPSIKITLSVKKEK